MSLCRMSLNKVMLLAALAKEVEHPLWAKTCSREKWPIGKVQRAAGGSSANRKEMHQATKTNPRVQAMRDNADGEGVTATTTRRGRRDMRAEEFTDSEKGLGQAARLAQEQSARRTRGRESLSQRDYWLGSCERHNRLWNEVKEGAREGILPTELPNTHAFRGNEPVW